MLRAMRDIARNSGENDDYEAMSVAVEGLSERAHLIVDACIQEMGDMAPGNYSDHDWDSDEESEEGGAA